jgi:hypothetical protein
LAAKLSGRGSQEDAGIRAAHCVSLGNVAPGGDILNGICIMGFVDDETKRMMATVIVADAVLMIMLNLIYAPHVKWTSTNSISLTFGPAGSRWRVCWPHVN